MRRIDWAVLDPAGREAALARPLRAEADDAALARSVAEVFDAVRRDGDAALRALTRRFDGVELASFDVDASERAEAHAAVSPALHSALAEARSRLRVWHRAGMAAEFEIETAPGVRCGRLLRPIGRVGLYVPAGTAPLPSTALMLGVPAQLAGCEDIVLCTPPRADGRADPAVVVAADLCGIRRIVKLGGAQAIAAMAIGTASVPRRDKLFGPGSRHVTAAKRLASSLPGGPAIDLPAGPSEVMVIADAGADPAFVAADLLSQAEHGDDSQSLLVTDSAAFADAVVAGARAQCAALPRADVVARSLAHARAIVVPDLGDAFDIAAAYAPEHLILALRDASARLADVRCAGSVFVGDHAPEALGDYCSGTNHVLPTDGAARAWSGVGVDAFRVSISVQAVTAAGLAAIGPCAVEIARAEGLEAHARAVLHRLESVA